METGLNLKRMPMELELKNQVETMKGTNLIETTEVFVEKGWRLIKNMFLCSSRENISRMGSIDNQNVDS